MCLKNGLIPDHFWGEIYESQRRTTNKTIEKRFRISVTKQVKKFTKYQGHITRKLLQKAFCQVNK